MLIIAWYVCQHIRELHIYSIVLLESRTKQSCVLLPSIPAIDAGLVSDEP